MILKQGDPRWWDNCGCGHDRAIHSTTLFMNDKITVKGWNDEGFCGQCKCKEFSTFETMIEGLLE